MSSAPIELSHAHVNLNPAEQLQQLADFAKVPGLKLDRDVYGEGSMLNGFEAKVAKLLGKESGMFAVSGVMSQLIALRIHSTNKNKIFGCHPTCHLEINEHKAYDFLLGFSRVLFGEAQRVVTFEDIESAIGSYWKQPCAVVLELPMREIGGQCMSWDDLVKTAEWCRSRSIRMHLDGARLWEAQTYYQKSFADICALFDSVYVSFYKGFGAMGGAMLLGSSDFIDETRIWLRRFGGNLYTLLPLSLSAQHHFDKHLSHFSSWQTKMKMISTQLTIVTQGDDSVIRMVPPIPQVPMCHIYLRGSRDRLEKARDHVRSTKGVNIFDRLRQCEVGEGGAWCCLELKVGPANNQIPSEHFRTAFAELVAWLKAHPESPRPALSRLSSRPSSAAPRATEVFGSHTPRTKASDEKDALEHKM